MSASRNRLREIILATAIVREGREKIVTSKNQPASWLLDLRRTFMDAEGLELTARLFWERFAARLPFQVGGLEAGSVPLVAAIILEGRRRGTPINGFFIRKERKTIGRQQVIEGRLTRDPIVIVDDLLNSGGTLDKVVVALREAKRVVRELFVVVDYENLRGQDYVRQHNIAVTSLFSLKEFGLIRGAPSSIPILPIVPLWHFRHREPDYFHVVPKSAPVADRERVYFGTDSGLLYALAQADGRVVWTFQAGRDREGKGIFSSPVLHAGRLYFGSYDGNCYSLDARTGAVVWRAAVADWIGSSPALAPKSNLLFIGLEYARPKMKGGFVALDLKTGVRVWEYQTASVLHGSPVFDERANLVVVGTNDGDVLACDAMTGRLCWRYHTRGPIRSAPTIVDSFALAASEDAWLYALDLQTGKKRWHVATDNVLYTTPTVVSGYVYLSATDKHVHVVRLADGVVIAKIPTKGRLYAPPRLIGRSLFVGGTCGQLYRIDPRKNVVASRFQFPERIVNAVTIGANGRLFVPTYDNQLFAFRLAKNVN